MQQHSSLASLVATDLAGCHFITLEIKCVTGTFHLPVGATSIQMHCCSGAWLHSILVVH